MTSLPTLPPPFSRRIAARVDAVAALNAAFATWAARAGLPRRTVFHVELILDELLMNIAMHGARPEADGAGASDPREGAGVSAGVGADAVTIDLCVAFTAAGDALSITVRDDARAFDPTGHAPADTHAPLAARPHGGLGVHLVRQLTRAVRYRRVDGCNHLELHKDIIPDA